MTIAVTLPTIAVDPSAQRTPISLVFKQQFPAITQQFFQGNIFMTIAVTLPTIAVDPSACGHNTPSCERYRFRFR